MGSLSRRKVMLFSVLLSEWCPWAGWRSLQFPVTVSTLQPLIARYGPSLFGSLPHAMQRFRPFKQHSATRQGIFYVNTRSDWNPTLIGPYVGFVIDTNGDGFPVRKFWIDKLSRSYQGVSLAATIHPTKAHPAWMSIREERERTHWL